MTIDLLLDFIWFIHFFLREWERETNRKTETASIKCVSKCGADEANQIIINGILFANDLFLDKLNIDNEEEKTVPNHRHLINRVRDFVRKIVLQTASLNHSRRRISDEDEIKTVDKLKRK